MKVYTPSLVNDITQWMRESMYIELYNEDADGRTNSTIGESQVVEALQKDSPFNIGKARPRTHEDFLILDDPSLICDLKIVDRIDTRSQNFLNGPKAFSHLLFGKNLDWKSIYEKVHKNEFDEHYTYIICLNQDNPNDILLREFGQFDIANYKINPSNPVQLNLTDEWDLEPTIRKDRKDLIISLIEAYFDKLITTRGGFLKEAVERS